jgi:hypothetical protein
MLRAPSICFETTRRIITLAIARPFAATLYLMHSIFSKVHNSLLTIVTAESAFFTFISNFCGCNISETFIALAPGDRSGSQVWVLDPTACYW